MLTKTNNRVMLSDTTYSVGKKLVQIWIPAASALYFGLGNIWGFPDVEQVVGSLAVIATFLGLVLGVSSTQYDKSGAAYDGVAVVKQSPKTGKKLVSLELNGDPDDIQDMNSVRFKIDNRLP